MRSTVSGRDVVPVWEIVTPARPGRVPGIGMAGFRDRSTGPIDLPVVPYPALTLVLEFGDSRLAVAGTAGRQRGSLVAGLAPGPLRVQGLNIECLQVRLSPVVARAVLGVSPAELAHSVVSLDELWGREAARLQERLAAASCWLERFALTEAQLVRRYEAGRPVDPEIAWAWRRIHAGHGSTRVDELAAATGWSRKRLWARFHTQLGLPPKSAAKLIRFDHAAHRLAAGQSAARVAADSGYTDQSHLHRDVLSFTGVTPATVAAEPWLAVDGPAWPGTFVQDQHW